jgi:hypothetical protein
MELSEQDIQWAKESIDKTGLFVTCSADELNQLLSGLKNSIIMRVQRSCFREKYQAAWALSSRDRFPSGCGKGKRKIK